MRPPGDSRSPGGACFQARLASAGKVLVTENASHGIALNLGWESPSTTVVNGVAIDAGSGVITATSNPATTSKVPNAVRSS